MNLEEKALKTSRQSILEEIESTKKLLELQRLHIEYIRAKDNLRFMSNEVTKEPKKNIDLNYPEIKVLLKDENIQLSKNNQSNKSIEGEFGQLVKKLLGFKFIEYAQKPLRKSFLRLSDPMMLGTLVGFVVLSIVVLAKLLN